MGTTPCLRCKHSLCAPRSQVAAGYYRFATCARRGASAFSSCRLHSHTRNERKTTVCATARCAILRAATLHAASAPAITAPKRRPAARADTTIAAGAIQCVPMTKMSDSSVLKKKRIAPPMKSLMRINDQMSTHPGTGLSSIDGSMSSRGRSVRSFNTYLPTATLSGPLPFHSNWIIPHGAAAASHLASIVTARAVTRRRNPQDTCADHRPRSFRHTGYWAIL